MYPKLLTKTSFWSHPNATMSPLEQIQQHHDELHKEYDSKLSLGTHSPELNTVPSTSSVFEAERGWLKLRNSFGVE